MSPTSPVTYTTPDGVERSLRFTLGARKRIAERFGDPDIISILNRFGDGSLPELAYALMYDAKGKPPQDLDLGEFAESLDGDDATPLLAAIISAANKGKTPKKDLEALLEKIRAQGGVGTLIGLSSGPLRDSVSGSPQRNSGTAPNENGMPSSNSSAPESAPETIAPES